MKLKEGIPYIIAICALVFGAFYDYEITDAFHQSLPVVGILFERIILIPIVGIVAFTLCLLYRRYHHILFLPLAYIASCYVVYDSLRYWTSLHCLFWLTIVAIVALVVVIVLCLLLRKVSDRWVREHLHFFLFFSAVLLCATLITTLLKMYWGRIRYRDIEDIKQFCVWYKPCGLAHNHSFPSGHMTAITSLLCVLQWKRNTYEKVAMLRYSIVGFTIVLMGISRMIMGAHFLSDLAAGFLITYSVYLTMRYIFRRRNLL